MFSSSPFDPQFTWAWLRSSIIRIIQFAPLLFLAACGGGSGGDTTTQPILDDNSAITFEASRLILNEGDSTLLRWAVADATSVEILPDIGTVSPTGQQAIFPVETTIYKLSARANGALIAEQDLLITVRPNAAVEILATVTEGPAPLKVRFTPKVQSSTAINRFYWDFEGNGGDIDGGQGIGATGFDRVRILGSLREFDVTGRDVEFTYEKPGDYTARLRVWDANDNQKEATMVIKVSNAAPTFSVLAATTQGTAPLQVNFKIEAYDQDTISTIQWDYDGDGVVDDEKNVDRQRHTANQYFTYENPGEFQPSITLIDATGESTVYAPEHLLIQTVATTQPGVTVSLNKRFGPTPLEVIHTVSSRRVTGSLVTSYEWDFDGDGTVDFTSDESRVTNSYTKAGKNLGSVTAVTEDGLRITNRFEVRTTPTFEFEILTPAIDPASDTSAINLSVTGDVEFELNVVSASGELVRTLLNKAQRSAGEYSTTWDGKNSTGVTQAPGDYYVIAKAYIDDEELLVDLRENTGGEIFYPNGWAGSRRCSGSSIEECGELLISDNALEPFNRAPVNFDISSPHNARMSAYVTIIGSDNFAATTFFRSRLMSPGETRLSWYGTGADGKLLPYKTQRGYLPAIYGITLASNSIVLNHRTSLRQLSVSPDIFHPTNSSSSNAESVVTFDLTRQADVTLTIDNTAQGVNVFQKVFRDVPAGTSQQLTWDGRDNLGRLVGPGGYIMTVSAIDTFGQETIPQKATQRVEY